MTIKPGVKSKMDDSRMPWPKEYFTRPESRDASPLGRARRPKVSLPHKNNAALVAAGDRGHSN